MLSPAAIDTIGLCANRDLIIRTGAASFKERIVANGKSVAKR
jgi:hypothetical protein